MPKINHKRIKPKWNPNPNAAEKRYREHIRSLPCLVCSRQATPHHVISDGFKKISKNHWLLVPLCYDHHQGQMGYHGLGSHDLFVEYYGIHTFKEAKILLDEYNNSR